MTCVGGNEARLSGRELPLKITKTFMVSFRVPDDPIKEQSSVRVQKTYATSNCNFTPFIFLNHFGFYEIIIWHLKKNSSKVLGLCTVKGTLALNSTCIRHLANGCGST